MPMCVFLFQAEDGIRARNVTGVQTCALPIFSSVSFRKSFISFFSAEVIDRVETFYRKAVEEESGEQGAIVLRDRSEEHTSELQSRFDLVCRLLLEKKKKQKTVIFIITRQHPNTH